MSPRPVHLSTEWRDNEAKLAKLAVEIQRIERDLQNAEMARFDDKHAGEWQQSARDALDRVKSNLRVVEAWLVNHDRQLLKQAAELLDHLANDGVDFNKEERELVEQLVDRGENL